MIKNILEHGYELIAEDKKELIIEQEGKEVARAKHVIIPISTEHEWIEVDEIIPPIKEIIILTAEEIKAQKIADLEAELELLKA